jgi:hypothetical protein
MNLNLIAIDLGVERLQGPWELGISSPKSLERQPDDSFTPSAHREQVGSQLAKLGLEVPAGVRGRYPLHFRANTMTQTGVSNDAHSRSNA